MKPAPVSRRHFISAALAGGAASQTSISAAEVKAGQFNEPAHDIPLAEDADVIVCGAGPAGCDRGDHRRACGGQGAPL
jgi:hypothetical protein